MQFRGNEVQLNPVATCFPEYCQLRAQPPRTTPGQVEVPVAEPSRGLIGVAVVELEPHELDHAADGDAHYRGRPVCYGYLKLSIPEFCGMLDRSTTFIEAVLSGALFVPNGLLGRWIGDNKLCLAVISDPAFGDLFDPADVAMVRPHIPWSRNIALCADAEVAAIRRGPERYVLKRPLDTRGRGVVIGREARTSSTWDSSVSRAIAEGWLVMEHVESTFIESVDGRLCRHDLALGLIDGVVSGGFVRSGQGMRVNVAQGGSVHSLFFDRAPAAGAVPSRPDRPAAATVSDTLVPAH